MSTLREQIMQNYVANYHPNSRIVSWDAPDSGLTFYTADQLREVDADWFPLSAHLDRETGKVVYGGKSHIVHTYTGGQTGAGKTTRFAMQSIRALSSTKGKPSFLVMDIHGELVENLYTHLKEQGYEIRILNCCDPSRSDTYNPFASMAKHCLEVGELDYETTKGIRTIANTIHPIQSTKDPIWEQGACSYTTGLILGMFEAMLVGDFAPENITLYNVIENHYWLRQKLSAAKGFGTTELTKIPYYAKKGVQAMSIQKMLAVTDNAEKTMRSYFGVIENQYDDFAQPTLYQLSSSSTIDVDRFIDVPTAIFIQAGSTTVGDHLLSMMTNDIYNTVVRRGMQSATKQMPRKIHCFLDEFANSNIADGPQFIRMLTTSRKFGMYWHLLLQCDAQLEGKYDATTGQIIRANCTELFMGSHDYQTTVRFAESCGKRTVESFSSMVSPQHPSLDFVPLITPDKLSLMEEGHLLIKSVRSHLLHAFIEAFYNCPEFVRLEDIRSVYPVNQTCYQDTRFTPDDVLPELSVGEVRLLRYAYDASPVPEDITSYICDVDSPTTGRYLRHLVELNFLLYDDTHETYTYNMSQEQFDLMNRRYAKVPNVPILCPLDQHIFEILERIHKNTTILLDELDQHYPIPNVRYAIRCLEQLHLVEANEDMTVCSTRIDQEQFREISRLTFYEEPEFDDFLTDDDADVDDPLLDAFRESCQGAAGYPDLDLSRLTSLTCVPTSLLCYLDVACNKPNPDYSENLLNDRMLKFEIIEIYIINNDFNRKEQWDQTIAQEVAEVCQLDYIPEIIKDSFRNAAREIRDDLTLGNIREIKKIVSGN